MPTLRKTTPLFKADEFTPTEFHSAVDKAFFANALANFVLSGFDEKRFTKKLYQTLSTCYGHIAHYSGGGFYAVWFADTKKQLAWAQHIIRWRPYGDAAYTFCDVERAFSTWLMESGIAYRLADAVGKATEQRERAELARLTEKYGAPR